MAPPPELYASNPPPSYSLERKSFTRRLKEAAAPYGTEIRALATPGVFELPDKHLLEMDSGSIHFYSIYLFIYLLTRNAKDSRISFRQVSGLKVVVVVRGIKALRCVNVTVSRRHKLL